MGFIKDWMTCTLFVLAAGGPVMAHLGWSGSEHIRDVETRGVEAAATLRGPKPYYSELRNKSYTVGIAWKDASGAARKAEDVSISNVYAGTISNGYAGTVNHGEARIKYLADDASAKPILLDDPDIQNGLDRLLYCGLGGGALGVAGLALSFLLGLWRTDAGTAG